jgi:ribosomal protein S18 acetylase RimI-like enzyme
MNVTIRQALPRDAYDIQDVLFHTWMATYPNEDIGITHEDIEAWFEHRHDPDTIERMRTRLLDTYDAKSFVAEVDGVIVGVCGVAKYHTYNQVHTIHVLPDFQGVGIGEKLWSEAMLFLDMEKPTVVEVAEYNKGAIAFYKHLGFVATGKKLELEKFRMPISGVIIPEVEMKRE